MVQQTPAPKPATEGHASTVGGLEVRSINYVPLAERHGKVWHLWPIWFTGDAHLATIAVGVLGISLGSNLIWTAIAIVAGGAFGTFFMAFHSTQGPQLGLPQMIQSRPQFGYVGALLVFVVALISYVGFNAFNQLLAGSVAQETLDINPAYIYVPFGVLAALLALVGYDLIHKAQRYLAYLLLAALTIFSIGVIVLSPFSAADFDLGHFNLNAFLVQFFTAATYQLSWAIYVSDYSRYLPPTVGVRASFWWTFLGAWIGGSWMMLVGTVAASLFNKDNVVSSVTQAGDAIFGGFGTILIVLAFLGLLTITGLNFYGASLTLLSAYDSIKPLKATLNTRIVALVVVAVAATTIAYLASGNFLTTFGNFIHFLGLPLRTLDRDQPDRLLLRAEDPLLDPGHLRAPRRHLRALELAGSARIRARIHQHDPVHGDRVLRRSGRQGTRRSRHLHDHRTPGRRWRLPPGVPIGGPRG